MALGPALATMPRRAGLWVQVIRCCPRFGLDQAGLTSEKREGLVKTLPFLSHCVSIRRGRDPGGGEIRKAAFKCWMLWLQYYFLRSKVPYVS